jgi:NADH-ubiquinone oxidoreductase chain 5
VIAVDAEFIPYYIKIIPTPLSLLGIASAVLCFFERILVYIRFYKFLVYKWYFDFIYNERIAKFFLYVAYEICFKVLDKGFVELLGPTGLTTLLYEASLAIRKQQTGFLYQYAAVMILVSLVIYFLLNTIVDIA